MAAIREKARRFKHAKGTDMKQMDQLLPAWGLKAWIEQLPVKDSMKTLFRMCMQAPYYAPPQSQAESRGKWMGDPLLKSNFIFNYGLPSGIAPNPDIGKWWCVSTYLCVCDDYFKDCLEVGVDVVMRGEHELYALLNMGDDNVFLTNHDGFKAHLDEGMKAKNLSPYMLLEEETTLAFLGGVFYEPRPGIIDIAPSLPSFFYNWFVAERGVNNVHRAYWPEGWHERKLHYAQNPSFSKAWEIFDRSFYDTFNETADAIALRGREKLTMPSAAITDIDREVIENPSKLFYKFAAEEVSDSVLDLFTLQISTEDTERYIKPYLK